MEAPGIGHGNQNFPGKHLAGAILFPVGTLQGRARVRQRDLPSRERAISQEFDQGSFQLTD